MPSSTGLRERYLMALDEVTDRLQRIVSAFEGAGVEYDASRIAVIGADWPQGAARRLGAQGTI
jgi:hypothetical protein